MRYETGSEPIFSKGDLILAYMRGHTPWPSLVGHMTYNRLNHTHICIRILFQMKEVVDSYSCNIKNIFSIGHPYSKSIIEANLQKPKFSKALDEMKKVVAATTQI